MTRDAFEAAVVDVIRAGISPARCHPRESGDPAASVRERTDDAIHAADAACAGSRITLAPNSFARQARGALAVRDDKERKRGDNFDLARDIPPFLIRKREDA
jgi:hypothetical protein